MRVPLSWLKEFVDIPADVTPEALAERLTVAGLEVGKIDYIGVPQSAERYGIPPSNHLVWDREKLVLGYIHQVTQHPDADRLVLAQVSYGGADKETVVTGAPNLFEYLGKGELNPPLLTPFALEGAEVIDGHGDGVQRMILKERKLRGIPNRCMVCSAMELGISDEHDGIMLLDHATYSHFPAGTPIVDVIGDVVLELELTPNLARCFSMLGVAREVAALYGLDVREPDYDALPPTMGDPASQAIAIDIQEPELNPRFTGALIRNVTIKDSPAWLQWRLQLIGQRPINNIVDVSNYVMFEVGQPTHAFDYDLLKGRSKGDKPTIITRMAKDGEELTTLDNKNHKLQASHLMVADEAGILSFGGVMGGASSEVQEPDAEKGTVGTTTVFLEAAAWNLIAIRKTTGSTKINTEASARFSRGVHPEMAIRGLKRGIQLMVEVSGGELAPEIIDNYPNPAPTVVVDLPYTEVRRLLGFEMSKSEIVNILRGLQMHVENEKTEVMRVTVPDHRLDIGTGIIGQADLIEEIARIYGYNNIPNTTIGDALPPQRGNQDLAQEEMVRDVLVQEGLQEVINYRFTTPIVEAKLTPMGTKSSWPSHDYVQLANPSSVERTALRQTLLSGLLANLETNRYHTNSQQLFEIGAVYYRRDGQLPKEPRMLGIAMLGLQNPDGPVTEGPLMDYYDLKGVIEALIEALHLDLRSAKYVPAEHNSFHPGRVAELKINNRSIGYLGEVHPLVREAFGLGLDLGVPVLVAELNLDALLNIVPWRFEVNPLPTQPPVYRDIAVVVPENTTAAEVEEVIWANGGNLLHSVRLFDVYRGTTIGDGHKSMAYALVFQSLDETLNDKVVNKVQDKIIKALDKAGAILRS